MKSKLIPLAVGDDSSNALRKSWIRTLSPGRGEEEAESGGEFDSAAGSKVVEEGDEEDEDEDIKPAFSSSIEDSSPEGKRRSSSVPA